MSDKKVSVTVSGGTIAVSPESVQPKKNQDKVQWESTTGTFTINLPGYSVQYSQQGQKYVGVAGTFPTVQKIKYSVSAPGASDLDPDVDIQP